MITNDIDTTVATSDNTYDRIIINEATENNLLSVGVMDDVTKSQSDHYLVYAVFNPEVPQIILSATFILTYINQNKSSYF